MEYYSLKEAQEHLQELIAEAIEGKTIFINTGQEQLIQLVPMPKRGKSRKAGSAEGLVTMSPDFDEPLADFDDYMP
jgi:antitoxin (DNA-binding transcriptional repressor) of toxin-antitoxin stability system